MAKGGGGGRRGGGTSGGIHLTREGYYTSPPFHQLKNYTECGIYTVEKLTIGRNGFGSITFDDPVNIKDLNFDKIVQINHKEVIVYPDEEQKPPAGHGLNCAAEVRLEKVWPFDGCASKYITDPQTLEEICFVEKLKETNRKCSTTFLKYIPETGSWIFKVEHFSKYGLGDTDEEAEEKEEKRGQIKRHVKENTLGKVICAKQKIVDIGLKSAEVLPLSVGIQTNGISPQNGFTQEKLQFIGQHEEDDVVMKEDFSTSSEIISHITDTWLKPFCLPGVLDISQGKIMAMKRAFFPEDKETEENHHASNEVPAFVKKVASLTTLYGPRRRHKEGKGMKEGKGPKEGKDLMESKSLKESKGPKEDKGPKESDSPKMVHIFEKYNIPSENGYLPKKVQLIKKKKQLPLVEEPRHLKGTFKQRPLLLSVNGLVKTVTIHPQIKNLGRNRLKTSVYKYPNHLIPLNKVSTNELKSQRMRDLDAYKGHGFRVGWGPGGVMIILATQRSASTVALEAEVHDLDKYLKGRSTDDNSKQIVQRICLRGGKGLTRGGRRASYENELREYLGQHLNVKLKHSEFYEDETVPGVRPISGNATITSHNSLTMKDDSKERDYPNNVWSLCDALWGELPEYVPPVNSHHNLMLRKEYLGDWLTSVHRKTLLNKFDRSAYMETARDNDSYLEEIWNLVTGNMIKEACHLARKNGDTFLVTLLTQLPSSQLVSHLLREQVTQWINIGADILIKRNRLKLFLLLCGLPMYNGKDETVNVCENLDWKRTLGLHIWYLTSNVRTIKDAFTMFQKAFNPKEFYNLYAKAPFPPYREEDYIYDAQDKLAPLDLCYHVICLYCDRFYSMAKMFDPVTHTLDLLDYSLSWLVYTSLHAVGYHHTSEYGTAHVHSSFAAQLESYGMWQWAVFVLLHIHDKSRRQMAIRHMLERNLCSDGNEEYKKKECFLKNVLKIPASWIYEIKAHKSLGHEKYHFAACFLNKARQFNFAHKVLMKHLAPHYAVNEKYSALIKLLKPLAIECKKQNYVYNWKKGGYVIWLYLKVMTKIKHMLKHPHRVTGYELESVQVDAISLCKLLPDFIVTTTLDRWCQIELSDRIFDLVGEFIKLLKNDQLSCRILLFMTTKLPMPDNFKVLERRNFIKNWPDDFENCRLFT